MATLMGITPLIWQPSAHLADGVDATLLPVKEAKRVEESKGAAAGHAALEVSIVSHDVVVPKGE